MKTRDGEFIELTEEGGSHYTDELIVRGHVDEATANESLESWWSDEFYDEPLPERGPWKHKFARWSQESTWNGSGMVLRIYDEPGRGRFKITVCEPKYIIDARELHKLKVEQAKVKCVERFGDIDIELAGEDWVRFRIPNASRLIMWSLNRPDEINVSQIDRPAWDAWWGLRLAERHP